MNFKNFKADVSEIYNEKVLQFDKNVQRWVRFGYYVPKHRMFGDQYIFHSN